MKCSMMTAMVNVKIASGEVVWKTKDFFFQIENVLKRGIYHYMYARRKQNSSLHHQLHEQEKKGKCFPEIYITITITSQLIQSAQLSLVSDDFNNTLT